MSAATEVGGRVERCCGATGPEPTSFASHARDDGMMCAMSRVVVGVLYLVLFACSAACHLEASSSVAASVGWIWSRFRASRRNPALLGDR